MDDIKRSQLHDCGNAASSVAGKSREANAYRWSPVQILLDSHIISSNDGQKMTMVSSVKEGDPVTVLRNVASFGHFFHKSLS